MNRIAGIVVAVIGLVIAVLSIAKIIPSLTVSGVCLILLGGLVIGLSFIDKPDTEGSERMSTASTLGNIFFAPSEVFGNLRRHPRWLVAAIIMSLLSAVYLNAFMYRLTPERVANYAIDKTLQMSMLDDNARAKIEQGRANAIEQNKNPVLRTGQAVNSFVGEVFLYAFLGLVFFLFALAMGGKMNYWQAFAVAVYAFFPVTVIRQILNLILLFIKDPADIHPILGQRSLVQDNLNFLVAPADHPVIFVLLGWVSILWLYWIVLNSIGLKNAGERVSSTAAWAATLTIWAVGLLISLLFAMIFPSFLS
ncbi:MAG TPA: YIP1 family protein [Pyrinomonadaceae bacterium]|nr:YIP1 family protein [Pyrinomonadaceae bacterium]